jgi:hypothetical protein
MTYILSPQRLGKPTAEITSKKKILFASKAFSISQVAKERIREEIKGELNSGNACRHKVPIISSIN